MHASNDSLRHIAAFVQAAERGSFVAAGEALGLTGSAVSKAVAVLERSLGVPLLLRSTRGISLTSEGQAYRVACQRALAQLDQAREHLIATKRDVRGTLRVLMHPMPGRARVAAALPQLLERHPHLTVEMIFYEGFSGLEAAGADVALVMGEPAWQRSRNGPATSLVLLPLAATPQWACASSDYLARHGEPRHPSELAQHRCIAIVAQDGKAITQWRFVSPQGECDVTVEPRLAYNDGPACRVAAVAGHGVVRLPQIALEAHVRRGELVRVLADWDSAGQPLNLMYAEGARRMPKVRAFVSFMQTLFADLAGPRLLRAPEPGSATSAMQRWKKRNPMGGQGAPQSSRGA